ncbi:protein mono-ADP-ribosyltransferase TIPARP isoform X2 [Xenopus laevis]|nr:protein mono-ADP-ribosyltransferase TIPARP isoform X2 [Xenopus laevis]OCT90698.1 hypothetical protein XELAEV_18019315mg [Xenopus laevis]
MSSTGSSSPHSPTSFIPVRVTDLEPTNDELALQQLESHDVSVAKWTPPTNQDGDVWEESAAFPMFHFYQDEGIDICSDFLAGQCAEGEGCPRHHTMLPYWWQIRESASDEWTNVDTCAQGVFERLFCDPKRENVTVSYQNVLLNVNFTSMEVLCNQHFNRIRRLSTCTSVFRPFHTLYKYYYMSDHTWEEYSPRLIKRIERGLSRDKKTLHCSENGHKYSLHLSLMYQVNEATGRKRSMRMRPLFRSLALMAPELRTLPRSIPGINPSPCSDQSDAGYLYPKSWVVNNNLLIYERVPLTCEDREFFHIYRCFHFTMPESSYLILEIFRIQNYFQWERYSRKRAHMRQNAEENEKRLLERHLFHGTDQGSVEAICRQNFDPRMCGKNGILYGQGCYFARDASNSNHFTGGSLPGHRFMFLAKVLVGRPSVGHVSFRRPPQINPSDPCSPLYDSCVSSGRDPSIFVIFDNDQCFPYFLIKYQEIKDSVALG